MKLIDPNLFNVEALAPEASLPLLVTVPHAGIHVPQDIETTMLRSGEKPTSLLRRLMAGSDPYTDRIYAWPEIRYRMVARVSRFVVDLNRAQEETDENGVIKTTDFNRQRFYPDGYALGAEEIQHRLERYWEPPYRAIENELWQARQMQRGYRLLVDGHSMSAKGPTLGPDDGHLRPAICLGVTVLDGRIRRSLCHGPAVEAAMEAAQRGIAEAFPQWPQEFRVRLDQPFDGGEVVRHFSRPDSPWQIPCLMLECNRDLYLNETTLLPIPEGLEKCREVMRSIVLAAMVALG